MSRDAVKRYAAILPSREIAKLFMNSDLNLVSCFGGPPSSGVLQMFRIPEALSRYAIDFPSGSQAKAIGDAVSGNSMVFTGSPPSKGSSATLGWLEDSSGYTHAISLPSGEIEASSQDCLATCTGVPPSIPTLDTVQILDLVDINTTELPSGEQTGYASTSLPNVSCFGFVPSRFIRQMFRLRERFDWKTT